ncbi:aromatic hydrocarbon degradation protein [Marinobacter vulgaris]|uniref:Aromatic hydrocarbon degradation protein n=1 Tax=Marinobacter vulgaris TaxID=1928331 RepID=A0A2V3ZFE3_9GAMM|nr:outer membrane protein transport protein [Marinobacter vulgaris]PXX88953.1 aromatic hydrocarbon degradation protein [Marinobacter vulgaris]TSJ66977.1 aromatic hydrocarbon degradation protein [Marinobacter vulgaris]
MRNKKSNLYTAIRFATFAAAAAPASLLAGGFSLNEQSASAMGVANAGTAANPENATTVFFNPAGMSQLSGTNISFGAAVLDIDAELKEGTGSAVRDDGRPVTGGNGGDIAEPAVLPNFYLTREVNDWLDVGFGIHAPYGLAADYDDDFKGRFFADETELTAIAFSPSIAVNDGNGFSMGAGVNVIYAEGKLTKFQDYSRFGALKDGYADVEGDDVALTFAFGMLWELSEQTQFGISAQTGAELELEGEAEIRGFPQINQSSVGQQIVQSTVTEKAMVPLEIPESITFGARHRLTGSVTLLAGATWAKWSRFEALDIVSREDDGPVSSRTGPNLGDDDLISHVSENWQDTWQANVGAIWQATPEWAFKTGYAWDESPVNDDFRTARIPSGDREWLTLGAQYADARSGWTVDVAAGVLLFDDEEVNEQNYDVNDDPLPGAARFQGTYELDAWSAGVQVSKSF